MMVAIEIQCPFPSEEEDDVQILHSVLADANIGGDICVILNGFLCSEIDSAQLYRAVLNELKCLVLDYSLQGEQ